MVALRYDGVLFRLLAMTRSAVTLATASTKLSLVSIVGVRKNGCARRLSIMSQIVHTSQLAVSGVAAPWN
jgi:hypothetical protein